MHPQLEAVSAEFESAGERLNRLSESAADEIWTERPSGGGWSIAECVAHLNLTSEAFLPVLRAGIEEGRSRGEAPPRRFRRDPIGWLLWRTMGPPVRMRLKTAPSFVPGAADPPVKLRREFWRLQAEQLECVRTADGLPLQKLKVRSPFDSRVSYNLFSALTILPRHLHRHLWQAERVRDARSS
jgi:hypothetical protein